MLSDLGLFLRALVRHAGLALAGGGVALGAFLYGWLVGAVNVRHIGAVASVVVLFWACFLAWRQKHQRVVELETTVVPEAVATAWGNLEERFRSFAGKGVGLNYRITERGKPLWELTLERDQEDVRLHIAALCKLAAVTLRRFPRLRESLPPHVLADTDPATQWFRYLAHCGEFHERFLPREKETRGRINDLAAVSAQKCVECQAYELR